MARYFDVHPANPQPRAIAQVAEIVRAGGVIAYPHDLGDLGDRPGLRVGRMNVKVPGYARSLSSRRYQDQRLSLDAGRGHGA